MCFFRKHPKLFCSFLSNQKHTLFCWTPEHILWSEFSERVQIRTIPWKSVWICSESLIFSILDSRRGLEWVYWWLSGRKKVGGDWVKFILSILSKRMTNLWERSGSRVHVMVFFSKVKRRIFMETPPFLSKPHPPFLVSWKIEDATIKSSKMKDPLPLWNLFKTLICHLSSRTETPIDSGDLAFFHFSFLGQEGRG